MWIQTPMTLLLREAEGLHDLRVEFGTKSVKLFKCNPMNAIHWASIDRFLNAICAVSILTNCSRTAITGLDNKSIRSDMSTISATDAYRFINPNRFFSKSTTQQGFIAVWLNLRLGCGPKSK
tara:strand:- start:529 stop:894 length:366 start_codon:yes stop_codon:yes gene_type:complete